MEVYLRDRKSWDMASWQLAWDIGRKYVLEGEK